MNNKCVDMNTSIIALGWIIRRGNGVSDLNEA